MEEVEKKYKNFIDFIQKNIKNNNYITILSNCSVNKFLEKLNERKTMQIPDITKEICLKCDIDLASYSKEIIDKFERYISYFIQICFTIY